MATYSREDSVDMEDVRQKLKGTGADIVTPVINGEIVEVRAEGEYVDVNARRYGAEVNHDETFERWSDEDKSLWDEVREIYPEEQ